MVGARRLIAAIGNFDGVHRGHQHLLAQTRDFALAHDCQPAVVTFDPHPRRFFRPDDAPFLLTTPSMRAELLKSYGAQEVFVLTFDASLAETTPEAFMLTVLKEKLGLAGVVAGADFRFGKGRAGGIQILQSIGEQAGMPVRIAEVISDRPEQEKFSSSLVRNAIASGDMLAAAVQLGRPWAVRGVVTEGQRLGRTLGFATANFTLGEVLEPRRGVYAVEVHIAGATHKGVANFGRRPTVGESPPLLETHLLDFTGDLYGHEIDVSFRDFIRDEQKFDGLDALKDQISRDCERARAILA